MAWTEARRIIGACLRSIVRYIDIPLVLGQFVFVISWELPLLAIFAELVARGQGAPAARRIVAERNCLGSH
jgi:hypothetical protein